MLRVKLFTCFDGREEVIVLFFERRRTLAHKTQIFLKSLPRIVYTKLIAGSSSSTTNATNDHIGLFAPSKEQVLS